MNPFTCPKIVRRGHHVSVTTVELSKFSFVTASIPPMFPCHNPWWWNRCCHWSALQYSGRDPVLRTNMVTIPTPYLLLVDAKEERNNTTLSQTSNFDLQVLQEVCRKVSMGIILRTKNFSVIYFDKDLSSWSATVQKKLLRLFFRRCRCAPSKVDVHDAYALLLNPSILPM